MENKKKVVMCNAEFYDVTYVINPWMKSNLNNVNRDLAIQQWKNLKEILQENGVSVKEIKGLPNCPDMVFTANHGIVIKDSFIVTNFKHTERKPEIAFAIKQILENENLERIDCPFPWEGEAELFPLGEKLYIGGYGKRGTLEALKWFEERFGIEIIPLEIKDDKFYHLDTCMTIRGKKICLYSGAFTKESLENLKENMGDRELIEVSEHAANNFGLNCIHLHNCTIIGTLDKKTKDEMENLFNVPILQTDMSEFVKSGGSAFCSKLFL